MTPQGVIDRTSAYWRLWVGGTNINFGNLPPKVVELFKRSLLVAAHADRQRRRDHRRQRLATSCSSRGTRTPTCGRATARWSPTRSTWPASPTSPAGSTQFCQRVITEEGYFLHKYNPDGSPAPARGTRGCSRATASLPIQEDETALVVWALWRHYFRYRDIEFIRPLWVDVVQKAADFMVRYRDPRTGLPLPSYDLWEERWGVHAFTVATVYGGLKAAHNFAVAFGDRERAASYAKAAEEMKAGAAKYLFSEKLEPLRPPAGADGHARRRRTARRTRSRRR